MKLKQLLLFLVMVGYVALVNAQTKPYKNLIITEARFNATPFNYVEFTNMGNETIDLSEFEFGSINAWEYPWTSGSYIMLPKKTLAPGKSFVIATAYDFQPENWGKDPIHNYERVTKPEMYKLADIMLHVQEQNSNENDSITPGWGIMDDWAGYYCWFLRHHYINTDGKKDSMVIDQVGGVFGSADGTVTEGLAQDVAGVKDATSNATLIRKFSVKTGITDFSSHDANAEAAKLAFEKGRGLDFADSEWIPVPDLSWPGGNVWLEAWRAVFWTVGNHLDAKLDANTLVSKTGKVKVDLAQATITVPWGVRNDDSLMYQFERRPGLAWKYDYAPTTEDSAYVSARTGDKFTLYVCGNEVTIKEFTIIVQDPSPSDNIVIPKFGFDYTRMAATTEVYSGIRVTDGVIGMDTISNIDFETRVDTLFKYLEKAPKASWKIISNDGFERPELKPGDKLRVTSENGKVKDYFLKLEKFLPSADNFLASITWPDMPAYFKGDIAGSYGWKGDTIPGFAPTKNNYIVRIPLEFQGIPALVFTKQQTNSKVVVKRASTLEGTPAERTVTFTVTAENDFTVNIYTVRFEKEKYPENIQPWKGEPFFSQFVFMSIWDNSGLEICNPGTEPLDLSNYMIIGNYGDNPADIFNSGTGVNQWAQAYSRYVPGKKWQDQADWKVQPAILVPDLATNAIVYPGDVFVIADIRNTQYNETGDNEYRNEFDIDFSRNPWGRSVDANNCIHNWSANGPYMWKILNDSVKNGLKPATDLNDFELIEVLKTAQQPNQSSFRKPYIYKPNPVVGGSNGTTPENSEWTFKDWDYYTKLNYGWPDQINRVFDGIGSHIMDEVTIYKSTVTSVVYKISPGYTKKETIKGLTTGTIVAGFYNNILKANPLQTLKVKSASTGLVIPDANAISKGDTLIVLSADSVNTSKYILDVTATGLSANALLTSTKYTINATGTTGTVAGFPQRTPLKTVFAGVTVPAGATITITDAKDAYMSLSKLNYDTAYVNVIATDNIYFEVIAENGTTKIRYQLKPTSNPSDAYVTSDVYSVDQFAVLIQFIPAGTSAHSMLSNVTPAPGATMVIFDKAGFVRTIGDVYRDDKLIVTSADGKTTKAYYFSMLNFNVNTYLAYVISDDYQIDQVKRTIVGPKSSTTLGEFYAKLYPSFGATLKVLNKNGVESKLADLSLDDKLLVTAADGKTTVVYNITVDITGLAPLAESIKMYPNPTTDQVIINGLARGNRVQVFNTVGVTLRDVIVDNSTEYVSLSAQPAGIYVFVISSGEKYINIQKIVKK